VIDSLHVAKKLTLLKVFLGAPGDLTEEREVASRIVARVNLQIAEPRGFMLKLVQFPSAIQPGIGGEPQDVINRQVGKCDAYLVMFWRRFGTPTKRYASGTVEEFEEAYGEWLTDPSTRVWVYFSKRPFYPEAAELSELNKLFEFKNRLTQQGVLYSSFESVQEFETKLSDNLARLVLEKEALSGLGESDLLFHLGASKHFARDLREVVEETDVAGVVFVDLDNFKDVDKIVTPTRSNAILNELAWAMFNSVRSRGQMYRYGGDEFAIIIPNRTQGETIQLAERVRQAIERSGPFEGIQVTASLGVACSPSVPKGELFHHANQAVHASKLSGKNCVTIAPLSSARVELLKELKRDRDYF